MTNALADAPPVAPDDAPLVVRAPRPHPPQLRAYAKDHRLDPIDALVHAIQTTHSYREAADLFGVTLKTFERWRKRYNITVVR